MSPQKPQQPQKPQGSKSYLPFVIIAVVLLAVVVGAALLMRRNDTGNTSPSLSSSNASPGKAASNAAPAAPAAPVRRAGAPGAQPPHTKGGGPGAAVVLEEFADYQCPPCGNMHPVVQKIVDDYGDRVRVVFRNYPLQKIHKNAFTAARAAEAAALQGKFWQMNDMIFKNQDQWKDSPEPRPIFQSYAGRIGLDVEKFKADMDNQAVTSRVIADAERGGSLGVGGTPTMFINGRELTGEQSTSEKLLREAIEAELAAKKP